MTSFRTVLKNSSYMLGFQVLSRFVSAVFLIYAASTLGPEMFGVLSFVLVTVELLCTVGDLGITRYGARQLVRNWDSGKEVLSAEILVLQVLTSLAFTLVGLLLVFVSPVSYPKMQMLMLGLLTFFLYGVINTTESIFVATQRFFYSAFFSFLGRLIYVGAGMALLISGRSVVYVMLAFLLGTLIEAGCRVVLVVRKFTSFSFNFPIVRIWRLLVLTFPFALAGIAGIVALRINVIILEFLKGDAEVGFYNVAFSLLTPIILLTSVLNLISFPGLTEAYHRNSDEVRHSVRRWYRLMALAGIPLAMTASLLVKPVLSHFTVRYISSASILTILVWTLPIALITAIDFNVLQVIDKERVAAIGTVISAVGVAALSFILVPLYAGMGAAAAIVIAFFIEEVFLHLKVRDYLTKKLALSLFLGPAFGGLVMGLVALLALTWNIWLVTALALVAYIAVILLTGTVRPSEIKLLARS
ncbi:MAG: oligosaccharide flippase family protein [Thermoleophilia bacterium]